MDEVASNLLATLKKSSASIDSKLSLFNTLKSHIKHSRVPENAQIASLECIRLAIMSQTSSSLVTAGFSTLSHLIKRLALQDQMGVFFTSKSNILQPLLDKMGDAKESYRSAANQTLSDLWPARPEVVEKAVKEGALQNSNIRAKESGIVWITKMHDQHSLQFRTFVPPLVECLSHADGGVRDCAKNNIVELFRGAPDRAKADLKRQLIARDVRKSIATHILTQLLIPVPAELSSAAQSQSYSQARSDTPQHDNGTLAGSGAATEASLPPSVETTHIDPLFVETQRDLEDIFKAMSPCFEGREDESNWKPRDNSVLKLRRLLKGNAPSDFQAGFVVGVKGLLDGILKVANTLRTTMSTNGCQFFQELASTMGPAIDSMVEILFQSFLKMCSATKHISSQNGNATIDVILYHVSYNNRLSQHVWSAAQDKNVQPRIYAAGWLKSILKKQSHNKTTFEHSGGLDLAEKSIKKGLADANPKVRENMRATYWFFAHHWPSKGDAIMSGLDAKSKQLLEKDASNPNSSHTSFTSSVGPTTSAPNPRVAPTNARASLKETIAAQKKAAMAAKRLPDRPNSAMANLSPDKPIPSSIVRHAPSNSTNGPVRAPAGAARPTAASASSSSGQGSLMSGPVRRPRRVDPPRPATADPYANRRLLRGDTPPSRSPGNSPVRPVSKGSSSSAMSNQARSNATSSLRPGTSESVASSKASSPQTSPVKARSRTLHGDLSSNMAPFNQVVDGTDSSAVDENLTVVAPNGRPVHRTPQASRTARIEPERPVSNNSNLSPIDDDDFTMVMPGQTSKGGIPTLRGQNGIQSPRIVGEKSPQKSAAGVKEDDMMVYEDPSSGQGSEVQPARAEKMVLEELPVNEQNQAPFPEDGQVTQAPAASQDDNRRLLPEKSEALLGDPATQDRAEVLKNRRLLSSGIERLRAKTLDPHGFRRLQDLVRASSKESSPQLVTLLRALVEYLEAPNEALKVNLTKAQNLKSQALSTIRALVTLHRRDAEIRQELGDGLCAVLRAKKTTDMISHMALDLDKTAEEMIRHAEEQAMPCIRQVTNLARTDDAANAAGHRRLTTMALGVLSKLLATVKRRQEHMSREHRQDLARLAVGFLDSTDPDVRRADTDFCLELFDTYGQDEKEEFWRGLTGARESQLNLVAYYLARRGRASS